MSDLKAQVAANQQGIRLVKALIDEYDLTTVQAYMGFIQQNAEMAVRCGSIACLPTPTHPPVPEVARAAPLCAACCP